MAIQIRSNQLVDNIVVEAKINAGAVAYAKLKSADIETDLGSSASSTKLVTAAAAKAYADSVAAGLDYKESVFVATTANITLSGNQTIDGTSVTANKRILVKDQSTQSENGIYISSASGWSRASDFAAGSSEAGAFAYVETGTASGGFKYVCTSQSGSDVVGTNNITFGVYSGPDSTAAGDGLQKSGDTISVDLDGTTLAVSASGVKVNAGGITNTEISNSAAIAVSKLAASTISGVTLGGNLASLSLSTNSGLALSGSFNGSAARTFGLDFSTLAAAAVNAGADSIAIYDADADATGLESIADLATAMAGTGLTASSGAFNVGGLTNSEISNSAAIAVSKLAASTISGKTLGTNLADLSLSTNSGLAISANYNGSAAVTFGVDLNGLAAGSVNVANDSIAIVDADDSNSSKKESIADLVSAMAGDGVEAVSGQFKADLDGSTLSRSASGIKVSDLGVGTGQLANSGVTPAKLSFQARQDILTPNGSLTAFNLANNCATTLLNMVMVFRNGLLCKLVGSSPSDDSEYTCATDGSTTTVTFGSAVAAGESLEVRYLA
tara:strand:+ start:847 stop:2514 length:1668 start_codon:yes stop_codon:yes gene_type:complete